MTVIASIDNSSKMNSSGSSTSVSSLRLHQQPQQHLAVTLIVGVICALVGVFAAGGNALYGMSASLVMVIVIAVALGFYNKQRAHINSNINANTSSVTTTGSARTTSVNSFHDDGKYTTSTDSLDGHTDLVEVQSKKRVLLRSSPSQIKCAVRNVGNNINSSSGNSRPLSDSHRDVASSSKSGIKKVRKNRLSSSTSTSSLSEFKGPSIIINEAVDDSAASWSSSNEDEYDHNVSPPPVFPIDVTSCQNDGTVLYPNTRRPIYFETELFRGCALMKLRTDPLDPFFAPYFEGRKRTLEFQVQGKFKRPTEGVMYMGVEVPFYLKLGFFTKKMTQFMLNLLHAMTNGAHSHVGDKLDVERPHMVFPLMVFADRFAVTSPGSTPPKIGVHMLPEEFDKKGRSFAVDAKFNDNDTYSISFHSMYLDFVNWKVVNLPGLSDISLKKFFDDMPIHLVAYEIPSGYTGPHTQDKKKYLFNFEVSHTGGALQWPSPTALESVVRRSQTKSSGSGDNDSLTTPRERSSTICSSIKLTDAEIEEESGALPSSARDMRVYASVERVQRGLDAKHRIQYIVGLTFGISSHQDDFITHHTTRSHSDRSCISDNARSTAVDSDDDIGSCNVENDGLSVHSQRSLGSQRSSRSRRMGRTAKRVLAVTLSTTSKVASAPIRPIISMTRGGRVVKGREPIKETSEEMAVGSVDADVDADGALVATETAAAIQPLGGLSDSDVSDDEVVGFQSSMMPSLGWSVLRSPSDFKKLDSLHKQLYQMTHAEERAPIVPGPDFENVSYTIADESVERSRQCYDALVELLHKDGDHDNSQILALFLKWSPRAGSLPFLLGNRSDCGIKVDTKVHGRVVMEGLVARAMMETHWREEWMVLHPDRLCLYVSGGRQPWLTLRHKDIFDVSDVKTALSPFPAHSFFDIHTPSLVVRLCTLNASSRARWVYGLREHALLGRRSSRHVVRKKMHREKCRPKEATLLVEHMWLPSSRIVLNTRRIFFNNNGSNGGSSFDPVTLSGKLLSLAVDVANHSNCYRDIFTTFMDLASELRLVDLIELSKSDNHDRALAFYLNVYHALALHAIAVIGPPANVLARPKYFRDSSYDIGGEVFSLAELEYCILRGSMCQTKAPLVAMFAPKFEMDDRRRHYALQRPDARINFVLTTGTHANPKAVPMFTAEGINTELNSAASVFLESEMKINEEKRVISLPKVCDWFRPDFKAEVRREFGNDKDEYQQDSVSSSADRFEIGGDGKLDALCEDVAAQSAPSGGDLVLRYILRFLSRRKWAALSRLMDGSSPPTIKYMEYSWAFRSEFTRLDYDDDVTKESSKEKRRKEDKKLKKLDRNNSE